MAVALCTNTAIKMAMTTTAHATKAHREVKLVGTAVVVAVTYDPAEVDDRKKEVVEGVGVVVVVVVVVVVSRVHVHPVQSKVKRFSRTSQP